MSCIYKIICNDDKITDFYIGSTFDLTKRIVYHNRDYPKKLKVYEFIRVNGGWDNWSFITIEDINYDISKQDLFKKEQEWMDKLKSTLNSQRAFGHDVKQYNHDYFIKYYPEHKEKFLDNAKKYYKDNKEDILIKRKEYHEKNRETIIVKQKEYYSKVKEERHKQNKIKINCSVCNKLITKCNIKRHMKKVHI
jgi:hypothetical protein